MRQSCKALVPAEDTQAISVRQARNDAHLVELWLHGKPASTQKAYRADTTRFMRFTGDTPLHLVTLDHLQGFQDSLTHLAPATQGRIVSAVKSLLTFGQELGYLRFNVGRAVRLPKLKNTLAERILPETEVHRIIGLEPMPRNHAMLLIMYASGGRVSEIARLTWNDFQPNGDAGQVTLFGKGDKTRVVKLSELTWKQLCEYRGNVGGDQPVFPSRKKAGHLDPSQILRIVRQAAERAGIRLKVSPHWLRHAHASHAIDRHCPISLVQATLGHANASTTGKYIHARPEDSSARYLGV